MRLGSRPVFPGLWLMAGLVVMSACTSVPADATGAEIYSLSCARCHGSQLEGGIGPGLRVDSTAADQTDEFLVTTVSRGRGRMPSFSGALSDDQIARVVGFVRESQQK